ncbi:Ppx/GppA family phosphatase [bacterium]|nr:Ppx/GppA family phosphatase [bacterium]
MTASTPGVRSALARSPHTYAAIDLGTNNCRLMIAERAGDGFRVVDSYSEIVRLGEGLAATGALSASAMERTIAALEQCRDKLSRRKRVKGRYIATQACRAASNGRAFLDDVRRRTGLDLKIVSPKEEAKFALLGALDLICPPAEFALVIDIGGGSTELCWVDARTALRRGLGGCAARPPILGWTSIPHGVVTLSERFAGSERGFDEMIEEVRASIGSLDAVTRFGPMFRAGRGMLIGNSGTVTSLVGVHLNLPKYRRDAVDGVWLRQADAVNVRERLRAMTLEARAAEPCIGPQRADLVLAGCAILEAVWSFWPGDRLRVGDRGLREGVILSMIHDGRRSGPGRQGDRPSGRAPGRARKRSHRSSAAAT